MFAHEFMRNAFLAGTFVALACGLVGYFVVLRAEVFAGDALSHVAFTGALAGAAAGLDVRVGLFAATVLVALGMGAAGDRARADDAVIGSFFAWVLGLGVLFLSIFTSSSSGGNGTAGVRVLFGSIFGLSVSDARLAALLGALAAAALLLIARPLLFASLDLEVARAQGVRVRLVGLLFLGVLGVVAAEASQAVGALLLLGLLAAPAGTAYRLSGNPYVGLALSAGLAVLSTWGGLTLSYVLPSLPPSSMIVSFAALMYVAAAAQARYGIVGPSKRPRGRKLESVS
jgi:zinc/manganese transport system permease protein